jgi:hypothetical protein
VTLSTAVALAAASVFSSVTGMTAMFAGARLPVMVVTGALEIAKLVVASWLARNWRDAPLSLRAALVGMLAALMLLTAIGMHGFFAGAHLGPLAVAREAVAAEAAPIAEQIALTSFLVHDLDGRIGRFDAIATQAAAHASARGAMGLLDAQAKRRAELSLQREAAARRLADLNVELAAVDARRDQIAAATSPARYLAQLVGLSDGETAVKLIIALLVLGDRSDRDPLDVGRLLSEGAMTERAKLRDRRPSENFTFEVDGLRFTATVSRFRDGRIAELFLNNHNQSDTNARDAAILLSFALQHGADVEAIRRALCRDAQGRPSTPIGAALDRLAEAK